MNSALYVGTVMHARRAPLDNVFRYQVYQWLIDPAELPELEDTFRLFGWNRRAVTTWHDRDHIDMAEYLGANGIELGPGGRMLCLTNLRVLGYVFNPVSFWWCYRGDGELGCIVAEINNTFGERLPYLLSPANQVSNGRHAVYGTEKRIHVSPFMPMDQRYTWYFSEPGARLVRPHRRRRGGHAAVSRDAGGAPRRVDGRVAPSRAGPVPAAAGEGDLADPPAGCEARAQARAVLSQASVRARPRDDPSVNVAGEVVRKIVFGALGGLRGGELVLRYPDGRGRRFGDGAGPRVVVDLRRPDAFWRKLALRTRVGFGESYVDGDWDVDDLVAFFELLSRNLDAVARNPWVGRLYRLQELRPNRLPKQTPETARKSIHAHYDLGNDLFRLMLDPTMTYSCAYWERPEMTLEEAQVAKYHAICEKLHLSGDDHVLEIGCGWGGFAMHAAREYGCRVTALTISRAQHELASERVREAGLGELVEIREQDYRCVEGTYSRVASIEMLEAIGDAEHERYFAAIDRLLDPAGIAVIQTIAIPDERFERYRRAPDWIQQYVFPGLFDPLARCRLARGGAGAG